MHVVSRGGATILRVRGTNITASEASRKFLGLYPPHYAILGGTTATKRGIYNGEPIGQRCHNILLVVFVQF